MTHPDSLDAEAPGGMTHCPLTLDDLTAVARVIALAAPGVPVLVSKRSRKPGRVIARRTLLENIEKAQGNPEALKAVIFALALQNRAQWNAEAAQVAREVAELPVSPGGPLAVPKSPGRGLKRQQSQPAYPGDNWRSLIDDERMPRPMPQVDEPVIDAKTPRLLQH